MRKKIMGFVFCFLIGFCLCLGVIFFINHNKIHNYITTQYSTEEINFFYEHCFNSTKDIELQKWYKDIYYSFEGDTLIGDREKMANLAQIVNSLGISIKIKESTHDSIINLRIICGKVYNALADAIVHSENGVIDSAVIHIPDKIVEEKRRNTILWHELLHTMGLTSHVTTTVKSVLFHMTTDSCQYFDTKEARMLQTSFGNEMKLLMDKGYKPENLTTTEWENAQTIINQVFK